MTSPTTSEACNTTRGCRSGLTCSPYLVGIGIGVLSWLVFAIVAKPIGITTSLSAISGGVAEPFIGAEAVAKNSYWAKHIMKLDYGTLFLLGTFLGALASSLVSGTFRFEKVPSVWENQFGASVAKRYTVAFIGGILTMYGARLADGCTSGNGISQALQLSVVGWLFLVFMFVSALISARTIFKA